MPAASRLNDPCTGHGCFPPRNNASASSDVLVNGKGVHREGDDWAAHCCGPSCHSGKTAQGSPNVFTNGKAKARIGDPVDCGSAIASGSSNVFLNEEGGKASSAIVDAQNKAKISLLKGALKTTSLPDDCTGKRLIELPDTFDKMGWTTAAKLMRHWFAHPASTNKAQTPSVTISHDWLMQFSPYAEKYNELVASLWNDAAQISLKSILEKDGIVSGEFDYTQTKEKIVEKHHQSRPGGDYWYNIIQNPQEFDAAIGRFTLYAAAKGSIHNNAITIEKFSIVMRDNYDFQGDQVLGFFDCHSCAFSTMNLASELVTNESFKTFRTQTNQGGDFYVYGSETTLLGL